MSKISSIRNEQGIWINTSLFREAGLRFMKYGYYTSEPWGSPAWFDFWQEERRRMIEGYYVAGSRITGEHYFYLNYCPIQRVDDMFSHKSKKVQGFPDFWDGDYNYFWVREIAKNGLSSLVDEKSFSKILKLDIQEQQQELNKLLLSLNLEVKIEPNYLRGGWDLLVGKSRRKGYSFKNAAIAVRNYYTEPNSLTIFNAYEKKYLYPKGIMTMALNYINFINANTGLAMPSDVIQRSDHIKSSYIEYKNGMRLEKGFLSEVMALTCKDNADVNRGKDALDIIVEEAGAFGQPGLLKDVLIASQDCVMAGTIKTGMITVFGTSGDMSGGTYDYAEMTSRPESFGFLPFNNVWDENSESLKTCFFHPFQWNTEGFYDKEGNSDIKGAIDFELNERKRLIANGATSSEIQRRMQEKPLSPKEAFSSISTNTFPVGELKKQLQKVKSKNWQFLKGTPCQLIQDGLEIKAQPILDDSFTPITSFHSLPKDKRGCVMIYELPVPNCPKGLYKIGYDPIDQDKGTSLAAIIVYKSSHKTTTTKNNIVAEYIGRFDDPDTIDKIAEKLAIFYNTTIMYENMVTGVKNYFRRIKRLDLLAVQPDKVISRNIKNSKVARVYGCHMNTSLKNAGERYVNTWLNEIVDYDENENPITTIDSIYSIRLLEELIAYSSKGNFDLVSALFMCLFQVQEEDLGKVHDEKKPNKKIEQILQSMDKLYQR